MALGLCFSALAYGRSPSFETYNNPVFPGDHPDPTLTRIGDYFYSSGSSFNPTPKIYRSTDLVHWEIIAQPVSASWTPYGDNPGGGIWGGHMVLYQGTYWHYFGRGGSTMYFVTADRPEGPWSEPTRVDIPAGLAGLGVDNSIFIDEDSGKWYMLTKAGHENNHLVELGDDGQPTGDILDLTWLNPNDEGNPYGWAEGPVMWKANGYYFYSFAQHLVGEQYVMRSQILTDDESAWTIFDGNIFQGSRATYNRPNHISPVVQLEDGTSWTIVHSYHQNSGWYAHGRQGLLCEVTYDENDFPVIQFPPSGETAAPNLPSGGTPWMVPKTDLFRTSELNPNWSFLGYTPDRTWSLGERDGWLWLEPYQGQNTVIQNDGEHAYALITRVDFEPETARDEAGLWIINGPETHQAGVFSTASASGSKKLVFRFQETLFEVDNEIGPVVWLKLFRDNHMISGYFSPDGLSWTRIGEPVDAADLDKEQSQFNDFTGNQQGLYVKGKAAFFDLYIYKDAYTPISGECVANQLGAFRRFTRQGYVLDNIHDQDWAMYAGIEFGNAEYDKKPDSLKIVASSTGEGATVEVWLDSLDTGEKIAECVIAGTGDWDVYQTFASKVSLVSGSHDVYLRFKGEGTGKLFRLLWLWFIAEGDDGTSAPNRSGAQDPGDFFLAQNFPNPFNPSTAIRYKLSSSSEVSLKVFDMSGREVQTLVNAVQPPGQYSVPFDAQHLASGIYFYQMTAGSFSEMKKLVLVQ